MDHYSKPCARVWCRLNLKFVPRDGPTPFGSEGHCLSFFEVSGNTMHMKIIPYPVFFLNLTVASGNLAPLH